MGCLCVTYAIALVLLCPLTLSLAHPLTLSPALHDNNFATDINSKARMLVDKNLIAGRSLDNSSASRVKRQRMEEGANVDYVYVEGGGAAGSGDGGGGEGADEGSDYADDGGEGQSETESKGKQQKQLHKATTLNGTTLSVRVTDRSFKSHTPISIEPRSEKLKTTEESITKHSTSTAGYNNEATTKTVKKSDTTFNEPPAVTQDVDKLFVTAGKAFRYIIPEDFFFDQEDGANLTYNMYEAGNVDLSLNSWIQFLPDEREVYGLPLDKHKGLWNFIIEAQDNEGLTARVPLDITVQENEVFKNVNHIFSLEFRLNKTFAKDLDWQIRALEGILESYGDSNMEHLTVLFVTQKDSIIKFAWTNDTIPRGPICPLESIVMLWKEIAIDTGIPVPNLVLELRPELLLEGVRWQEVGSCTPISLNTSVESPPYTYAPELRKQMGVIIASVGHLLVYKIPEDIYFDPEDGGTPNLVLSLRLNDRSELPSTHWLQFNPNTQELYGVPELSDVGTGTYQMIVEDSSKNKFYDTVMVKVVKAAPIKPHAEFRVRLDDPINLTTNATNKRRVIEKLATLFGQKHTENIRIANITDNPSIVTWYNTSLRMDRCPKRQIYELQMSISGFEVSGKLAAINSDKDLRFIALGLTPIGLCEHLEVFAQRSFYYDYTQDVLVKQYKHGYPFYAYEDEMVVATALMSFVTPAINVLSVILIITVVIGAAYRNRATPEPESYPRIKVVRNKWW